jgi:hypothetical protein
VEIWRTWGAALLALATLLLVTAAGTAQEDKSPAEVPAGESQTAAPADESTRIVPQVTGPLAPVGPDTFILLDSAGHPQPVLGMTYEEFSEAWRKLHNLDGDDRTPSFLISTLTAKGRIEGDAAQLDVRIEIELKNSHLTPIPLGFENAILNDLNSTDESIPTTSSPARSSRNRRLWESTATKSTVRSLRTSMN